MGENSDIREERERNIFFIGGQGGIHGAKRSAPMLVAMVAWLNEKGVWQ